VGRELLSFMRLGVGVVKKFPMKVFFFILRIYKGAGILCGGDCWVWEVESVAEAVFSL